MRRKERRKMLILFVALILAMIAFGIVLKIFENHMPEPVISEDGFLMDEQSEELAALGSLKLNGNIYSYYHDFETYLIMGTDKTGADSKVYEGSMSDFLMLVIVDKTDNNYSFLPINRDTMSEVRLIQDDGTGAATAELQLCTAHWYGGNAGQSCANTVESISKLFGGLKIDGYYAIPMDEIPKLNHSVGGVTVTLLEDFQDIDRQMKKGETLALSDEQAYHYIHDRYGVGDEKNTSRMKRQQQYMEAFFTKAKEKTKSDKAYVSQLFRNFEQTATTNLTAKKISGLTNRLIKGTQKGFFEIQGTSKIGKALGDGIDHAEFYPDKESIIDVMTKIYGLKKRE
ncbi:MAG: LCP family protein [Eubacterium sp.]|nr:LCP family protein [Eubacterium sp.]